MALNAFVDSFHNIATGLRPSEKFPLGDGASQHSVPTVKSLPWFGTPVQEEQLHEKAGEHGGHEGHDGHDDPDSILHHTPEGQPNLVRHHETSAIQLFYDLFFVANLSTFTTVHEVNDSTTLKSYIGFFAILWFTWLQVTIFHLRLGVDSAFERICKGLQFGIMTGFAVVGPAYKLDATNANDTKHAVRAFQMLSIILMISRVVLVIQYLWAILHLRKYKKAILPLALHVLILLTTAGVFLGLFFTIDVDTTERCLIAWYVTLGLESGTIIFLAGNWTFLSFRRTNIVERISLLTLIIMGEGIIGLCGAVQKTGNDQNWGPDCIGMIICGVLVIYSIFMLYFDQAEHVKVGTKRQQFWIMSHFPMHVTILFTVEGSAQLIIWRKLIDQWGALKDAISASSDSIQAQNLDEAGLLALSKNLTSTFEEFYKKFEEGVNEMKHHPNLGLLHNNMQAIADLSSADLNKAEIKSTAMDYIQQSFASAAVLAGKNMGVEAPHEFHHSDDVNDVLDGLLDKTFGTVFTYFFIAAGLCIVMTAVLFILGRRHKTKYDWFNIGLRFFFGTGLALIATMNANQGISPAFSNYANSPWMLPTVAIVFVLVILEDNVLRIFSKREAARLKETIRRESEYSGA